MGLHFATSNLTDGVFTCLVVVEDINPGFLDFSFALHSQYDMLTVHGKLEQSTCISMPRQATPGATSVTLSESLGRLVIFCHISMLTHRRSVVTNASPRSSPYLLVMS